MTKLPRSHCSKPSMIPSLHTAAPIDLEAVMEGEVVEDCDAGPDGEVVGLVEGDAPIDKEAVMEADEEAETVDDCDAPIENEDEADAEAPVALEGETDIVGVTVFD